MNNRILVAEDNSEISKVIKLYLEVEGYEVFIADNGLDGLSLIKENKIDLAILDIMMPKMDGYELTREIRKNNNMPVLILSAKNEDIDKILGLNIGADDYITKPFNPLEIVARVNAALRRHYKLSGNERDSGVLSLGDLTLDTNNCRLVKQEKEIPLTATEFKILALLMNVPERIFSKVQISEHIKGEYFETDDNSVTVHISHLREKIGINKNGNQYIKTVKGLGYKIEDK
ncbi:response regulator transcription factor [Oceanirhabdus seepicola]|uniref:Stage 0 sporulation protein A homolog n=1 Tax=Oceanirhabdus seepicola TaxID=2828781 RepID=A0A9J6P002_9CLOT|nr:response regulator transcription factor [Oceanirhabdus seepicola]MCM1988744.1 response regulator transcription factor [Oceanirhabdus seepicola]